MTATSSIAPPAVCPESGLRFLRYEDPVEYREARRIQNELVLKRSRGEIPDSVMVLEHPPTLTLGARLCGDEAVLDRAAWRDRGVSVVETDRGGAMTYHGPGQLVLYPVIALRERRLGVRSFVESALQGIASALREFGIDASVMLEPAGVWVVDAAGYRSKIAAVGLRIERGVTNHGFSINFDCSLAPFSLFNPCGLVDAGVTSVYAELEKHERLERSDGLERGPEQGRFSAGVRERIQERVLHGFERALECGR